MSTEIRTQSLLIKNLVAIPPVLVEVSVVGVEVPVVGVLGVEVTARVVGGVAAV